MVSELEKTLISFAVSAMGVSIPIIYVAYKQYKRKKEIRKYAESNKELWDDLTGDSEEGQLYFDFMKDYL